MTEEKKKPFFTRGRLNVGLAVVATLFVILANSAVWFTRNIFDTKRFVDISTSAVLSQDSREAIAGSITDKLLGDRPVLRAIAGSKSTKLIAGLLDTDISRTVFTKTTTTLQIAVTSKNPKDIAFDLSGIKQQVKLVAELVARISTSDQGTETLNVDKIPDKLVLLDASKLPNIYTTGLVLMWLGPIFLLSALAMILIPLYKLRNERKVLIRTLRQQSAILSLGSVVALSVGPLMRPPVLANVTDENMRIVVSNVYDAFITKFNTQTLVIAAVALTVLIASYLIPLIVSAVRQTRKTISS